MFWPNSNNLLGQQFKQLIGATYILVYVILCCGPHILTSFFLVSSCCPFVGFFPLRMCSFCACALGLLNHSIDSFRSIQLIRFDRFDRFDSIAYSWVRQQCASCSARWFDSIDSIHSIRFDSKRCEPFTVEPNQSNQSNRSNQSNDLDMIWAGPRRIKSIESNRMV